jgi:hypothetical protein
MVENAEGEKVEKLFSTLKGLSLLSHKFLHSKICGETVV